MSESFELEICLGSVQSCIEAEIGGATRVELCDNLFEGGTTPSAGAIQSAREKIQIELAVMIRPRGGDFLYSELELGIMEKDIDLAIEYGADTVVFGLLEPNGKVDEVNTRRLVEKVNGRCKVTFHRAFDVSRDLFESQSILQDIGVDRILTSGGESSVLEGLENLQKLISVGNKKTQIMPGCGISEQNFSRIRKALGANAYHVTAAGRKESGMSFRHDRCFMGAALFPPEFVQSQVDSQKVHWYTSQS